MLGLVELEEQKTLENVSYNIEVDAGVGTNFVHTYRTTMFFQRF